MSADPLREKQNEKIIHFSTFSTTYIRESTIDEFFFSPSQSAATDVASRSTRREAKKVGPPPPCQTHSAHGRSGKNGGGNFFSPSTFSFFPFWLRWWRKRKRREEETKEKFPPFLLFLLWPNAAFRSIKGREETFSFPFLFSVSPPQSKKKENSNSCFPFLGKGR